MGWLQSTYRLLERPSSTFHGLSIAKLRQVSMARVCRVGLHRAVTFHCGTDYFLRWLTHPGKSSYSVLLVACTVSISVIVFIGGGVSPGFLRTQYCRTISL